ncbi:hypothetical protein GCM10009801_68550 [Streptomyces albiaxialis]|uniref:Secreted protein n=1 Tax=Streptomyces albiaxialis TaxID=329523 RepID=A0ABP5IGC2_9ACTN
MVDVLALIVAALSLLSTAFLAYRQLRLQTRLAAIEEARRAEEIAQRDRERRERNTAAVTAEVLGDGRVLRVVNNGPAEASDVSVTLAATEPGKSPPRMKPGGGSRTVDRLSPGHDLRCELTSPYGMSAAMEVRLEWRDGTGPRVEKVLLATGPGNG